MMLASGAAVRPVRVQVSKDLRNLQAHRVLLGRGAFRHPGARLQGREAAP